MKNIICFCFTLLCAMANAQNCGVLLFTQNGEKFKTYTNGTLQNETAVNEIKICGFPTDIIKIKLVFEDASVFEKTLYLKMEYIEHHRISKKSNGNWQITFDSDEEIPPPYANVTRVTIIKTGIGEGKNANASQEQTITTTLITTDNRCINPISDPSFFEFCSHLKNLTFESDKLKDAKDAIRRDCFKSKQIKIILEGLGYESSRVELAKYAYDFVYDKGAYALVKEGFSNSISGDELDEYLKGK